APEHDAIVRQRRQRPLERTVPVGCPDGVPARGDEPEAAPSLAWSRHSRGVGRNLATARGRAFVLEDPVFVARPPGSRIAEDRLQTGKVHTRTRPTLSARPVPERQPLSRVAIADTLSRAQHREDDYPNRQVRHVTLAWSKRSTESRRV